MTAIDDHSGLCRDCYTLVEVESRTKEGVLDGIRRGHTRPAASGGVLTLAHQVNSIACNTTAAKSVPIPASCSTSWAGFSNAISRSRSSRLRFRKDENSEILWRPKGTNLNLIEEIRDIIDNKAFRSLFEEGLMTRDEYNANVFNLASDAGQMIVASAKSPLLH